MTAELVSLPTRGIAGWAGRASQHRREQLRSRSADTTARIDVLWSTVAEVLDAVPGQAGAVLSTMDGVAVATHGLSRSEQLRLPREGRRLIASRRADGDLEQSGSGVVSADQTVGLRCTVAALVPGPVLGDHLLVVTALDVSAPLLHAWTTRAAEDLCELLSAAE